MVEVEIRNFQSIERVTVKIDGFTALVGRSNIGKSAIVRAVRAALTGAPADAYVRHGPDCSRRLKDAKTCKCACSVHIRAKDFDLFWEKGDSVNRYVFNGQEYTVAGKGTPDFLQATFGLVKIGDDRELLQVSEQFSPIFLLNQTGTVVADVLSDVARLDRINVAMRFVEKDRKEASANRKLREKDVLELKLRVAFYDGLDAAVAKVREVEDAQRVLDQKREKVAEIDRIMTSAFALAREIKALAKVSTIVVPPEDDLRKSSAAFDNVCRIVEHVADREASIAVLAPVEVLTVPEMDPVLEQRTTFLKLDGWVEKLRASKDLFTRWKAIEAAPIPASEGLSDAFDHLHGVAGLAQRYDAAKKAVDILESAFQTAAEEEADVRVEIDALGLCPTCTQPISSGHHVHSAGVGT